MWGPLLELIAGVVGAGAIVTSVVQTRRRARTAASMLETVA
jgi:hypothetical protein